MSYDANYDDYNEYYGDLEDYNNLFSEEVAGDPEYYLNEDEDDNVETDDYNDSMDGDAESAFGSCGWGVDEYYNSDCDYGEDY